jgi:hypothetical protein
VVVVMMVMMVLGCWHRPIVFNHSLHLPCMHANLIIVSLAIPYMCEQLTVDLCGAGFQLSIVLGGIVVGG